MGSAQPRPGVADKVRATLTLQVPELQRGLSAQNGVAVVAGRRS